MKKFIPAPVKETLRFRPTVEATKRPSTSGSKNWNEDLVRQIKIQAPRAQKCYADDNHTPGNRSKEQKASGMGVIIAGNHPRSVEITSDAEALSELS